MQYAAGLESYRDWVRHVEANANPALYFFEVSGNDHIIPGYTCEGALMGFTSLFVVGGECCWDMLPLHFCLDNLVATPEWIWS
jgi:hypothetical protein